MAYSKIDQMIAHAVTPVAEMSRCDIETAVALIDEEIENVRLQLDKLIERITALERRPQKDEGVGS
jgi:ubiquinone biosynthesis protein UbiJ